MADYPDVYGLTDFRTQLADLLRTELSDDIGVSGDIPDSIAPPSVYVTWSSPWLLPITFCEYTATAQIIVIAGRIEPGGQYAILESLVGQIIQILRKARIAIRDVSPPYPMIFANVNYLAASFNIIQEMGD
jgi:hypothetical protein